MFLASCSPGRNVQQITTIPSEKTIIYEPKTDELFDSSLAVFSHKNAENSVLLLLPMSGSNAAIGRGIVNACILASIKIGSENVDFFVVDTANPDLEKFNLYDEFRNKNLKAVIGPVFFSRGQAIQRIVSKYPHTYIFQQYQSKQ
jgi:hypothetical protein